MVKKDEDIFTNSHPTIATVDAEAQDRNITATIGVNMGLLKRMFEIVQR